MGKLIKSVIFGGKARVSVIDTTDIVNEAIALHKLSPLAAAALGRSLTAGAYISHNLKGERERFNLIIDGGGIIGKIVVAGEAGGSIRGFVENPIVKLPPKNGKLDVGGAIGQDGDIMIIKDLGLKEPYVGRSRLVSGEIAEDYSGYLLSSEGIPNAVALGVLVDAEGCKAAGGVIVEALPDAGDDMIFMLEDIVPSFANISALIAEKGIEGILNYYFGHLDAEIFEPLPVKLVCRCSEKIEGIIRGLGRVEADEIVEEQGAIEVKCDYCSKVYRYGRGDLDRIFSL